MDLSQYLFSNLFYFDLRSVTLNPKTQTAVSSIKKLVLVLILATVSIQLLVQFKIRDQLKEKSALYGLWKADSFQKNSQILQPLTTDAYRWQYFIFEEKNKAVIKRMTGEIQRFEVKVDTVKVALPRQLFPCFEFAQLLPKRH